MAAASRTDGWIHFPRRAHRGATEWLAYAGATGSAAILLGMLVLFGIASLPIFEHTGTEYLTSGEWFYRAERFGSLAMIYGTVVVSCTALLLAAPVSIGAAIFLAEIVPARARMALKLTVEMLAAVPSVVYGLLGVLLLREYVYQALTALGLDPLSGDTLLTASILLAVMILPTAITLADDALRATPRPLRLAGRALGLTRAEVILSVTLPHARAGLAAAILLAFGRALGETIAVFLVVGRQDNQLPESWLPFRTIVEAGQTLTSKLGGPEVNIAGTSGSRVGDRDS